MLADHLQFKKGKVISNTEMWDYMWTKYFESDTTLE